MSGAHFAMNVNTEVQQCSESRLRDYPQSSLLSQWQRVMANLFQLRTACEAFASEPKCLQYACKNVIHLSTVHQTTGAVTRYITGMMLSDDKHAVASINPTNICGLNKRLADSESVNRFTNEVVAFIVLN